MHKPKMTVRFLQRIVMPEWVALGIYYFDPLHPIFRSRRANEFMEKEEAMRQITSNETSARYNIPYRLECNPGVLFFVIDF